MKIELNNEETTAALSYYLQDKYGLGKNGETVSIDVVKTPKTGQITTFIDLTPPSIEKLPEPEPGANYKADTDNTGDDESGDDEVPGEDATDDGFSFLG